MEEMSRACAGMGVPLVFLAAAHDQGGGLDLHPLGFERLVMRHPVDGRLGQGHHQADT